MAQKSNGPRNRGGRPKIWTDEKIDALADEMVEWFSHKENLWLKDFAHTHGKSWQWMTSFKEKSAKFAEALKLCQEMQESKLFKLGLSRQVNPSMPIFALKNVAGWRDAQNINLEHSGTVGVKLANECFDRVFGSAESPDVALPTGVDSGPEPTEDMAQG